LGRALCFFPRANISIEYASTSSYRGARVCHGSAYTIWCLCWFANWSARSGSRTSFLAMVGLFGAR
jgi:hypothetical protein